MRPKQPLAGWTLSVMATLIPVADAFTMLLAPETLAQPTQEIGFDQDHLPLFATILLLGTLTYLVPRTALLGAILLTGFFGGAICAHLRIWTLDSIPGAICLATGLLVWSGLGLRDPTIGSRRVGRRSYAIPVA
jgi:DoxX-like protein